ncbi:MAG: transposase [Candidatus Freyarchaeota archaeon]|nr:transposase [Candidatus Jordarchaeia archaeon]
MQRSSHLPERKRPWSATRTKAPLWDRVSREARSQNLKEYFLLAEEIVAVLGRPWESSKRGRKPLYSPEKLAAMLIVKEAANLSFERLHAEAEAMGYDARTDQAKEKDGEVHGVPCPSQLHWAMTKIPEEYLQRALRLLDQMVTQMYVELFGDENLKEYSVDSTEDTCTILGEAQVAMRTVLQHQTVRYNILTRLATNTVRAVDAPPSRNTRDARNLLEQVPPGSVVYMDREYDVEYNYQHAHERGVTLIVRPKLYRGKPYKGRYRRQAQKDFDGEKYRRRKLVERPIGNRAARDGGTLKYRRPDMVRKGLILKYIAHNIHVWFRQRAWGNTFRRIQTR